MSERKIRLTSNLALSGAISRLAAAGVVALALWAGFFWATSSPGGL